MKAKPLDLQSKTKTEAEALDLCFNNSSLQP